MVDLKYLLLLTFAITNIESLCEHPQNYFCESDYFILARPTNKTVTTIGSHYKMAIYKIYKATKGAEKFLTKGIYVRLSSSLNGFNLDVGEKYIIGGTVNNLKAYTGFENYQKMYKYVSDHHKEAFENYYYGACDCRIQYCSGKNCDEVGSRNVCTFPKARRASCYAKVGYCAMNKDGVCKWVIDQLLQQCLKARGY